MTALDNFGEFVIANLRDRVIQQHLLMQQGHWKAPAIQELQGKVVALSDAEKKLLLRVVTDAVDTGMHDFLFALQEANDRGKSIKVLVEGENVAERSGMLQGEPFGDSGWIAKFSRFASCGRNS